MIDESVDTVELPREDEVMIHSGEIIIQISPILVSVDWNCEVFVYNLTQI